MDGSPDTPPDSSQFELLSIKAKVSHQGLFPWSGTAGHGSTHCQAVLLPTVPAGSPPPHPPPGGMVGPSMTAC